MFVPLTLVVIAASLTARIYNRSIYIIGVRLKNLPFLTHEIPHRSEKVTAEMMMKCPVRTLPMKPTVEQVKAAMSFPIVHGFPIVDEREKLLGLVSREALIVVIGRCCWIENDINSKQEVLMKKYEKKLTVVEQRYS